MTRAFCALPLLAATLAAGESRASPGIFRYTDDDGVVVLTNVAPGAPRKGLRMTPRDGVVQVSAPIEFTPRRDTGAFDPYIAEACALYRIPPALARAVMAAESNFNPVAVSAAGAMGLMQLMPQTAMEMFVSDAFNPRQNIHGGVRYLRVLANLFVGDMVQVLAA
jgi:hypothetical protein